MGNALVVGLIEVMGNRIAEIEAVDTPEEIQLEISFG